MSDMLHFVDKQSRVWEWWGTAGPSGGATPTESSAWQPWNRSWARGCTFLDVILVGAGAAGAAGAVHTVGVASAGGGGGSGGSITKARFLLDHLPDSFYFWLPQGAIGTSSVNSSAGGPAVMSVRPNAGSASGHIDVLLTSGGGAGGAVGSNGGGGAAAAVQTDCVGALMAIVFHSSAGPASANAGSGNASGVTATTATVCTGGGGGAGSQSANFSGGNVTITTLTALSVAGGLTTGTGDGSDGYWQRDWPSGLWLSVGGGGGGSNNTAASTGGKGGNAVGPGAGGGGGGTAPTPGIGGNGGPAYVMLVAS